MLVVRVGIVTPRYPPTVAGGGEISARLLVRRLDDRVDHVEVFSFDGGESGRVDGVQVTRFPSVPHGVFELSTVAGLAALTRHRDRLRDLDVLHGYNLALDPTLGAIGSRLNVASVATLNSYNVLPKRAFGVEPGTARRLYERFAGPTTWRLLHRLRRRIDRFVTLSRASKELYVQHGYPADRIDVVPNMVDPAFDPTPGDRETEGTRLLYVGSLIPEKGVEHLVRALDHLPEQFTARIVGDGPEAAQLRRLAETVGVDDRATFLGHVPYDDVLREYGRADVFVHPGVWPEPFGRTILEAMQARLPVVATDTGGPAETIPQSELLCRPADPAALADAVRAAADRPEVGAENEQYVTEQFAPERVTRLIVESYERAVERSSSTD
jgi:glycosyltransferase involved in cell wall biosynthesis